LKFKIDENLPIDVADLLHSAGHEALTVFDQELIGEDDRRILDICKAEERVLITLDLISATYASTHCTTILA